MGPCNKDWSYSSTRRIPLTVGQEWSGYAIQLEDAIEVIKISMKGLYKLAIGGTAVGTGLNAPKSFGRKDRIRNIQADWLSFCNFSKQIRSSGIT